MEKAKEILEQALSYKNCDGLIEENSRLEDAILYAINEALRQPPVSGELADFARFLSEEYSIEIHERIIDEWNKYYSANYR